MRVQLGYCLVAYDLAYMQQVKSLKVIVKRKGDEKKISVVDW